MPIPRRVREDGIVNWTTDPSKGQRLLDWLDAHKAERNVLFSAEPRNVNKKIDPRLTKLACGTRAAVAIFACDSSTVLRQHVVEDPLHFGKVVSDHIRNRLKKKYQKFNKEIGRAAANSCYKDIKVGGNIHKQIEKLMENEFPEWSRLHVYWRTNPYFNQYHTPPKARPSVEADSHEFIVVEDVSSPEYSSDKNDEAPFQSSAKTPGTRGVKSEPTERKRSLKDDDYSDEDALTKAQRHELKMEKLRLERQKLDIQKAQLEADACKRREKHQIMLQLMAFISGDNSERDSNVDVSQNGI